MTEITWLAIVQACQEQRQIINEHLSHDNTPSRSWAVERLTHISDIEEIVKLHYPIDRIGQRDEYLVCRMCFAGTWPCPTMTHAMRRLRSWGSFSDFDF